MKADDHSLMQLVTAKIEHLRPKLLDLTRNNPLLSTKLGPRSSSHIRVVDELPDIIFFDLNNNQELDLVALPSIDDDPRDEQTEIFRNALINARLTDETYLSSMKAVERDSDDYLDKTRKIERALRDDLRELLEMPARVKKTEINLIQHAKNNGILPSHDLPKPSSQQHDRHTDGNIQTLLLPNDLERKLNAILSKCRTWMQETGMNVLHVAFGFLEWSDGVSTESALAPMVLLQIEIAKHRTPQGAKFAIKALGDEPEVNGILAEKLRIDFGIELPLFEGSSIESYLAKVADHLPKGKNWHVRRQIVVGAFPSARMAMYHDLDTKNGAFPQSDIVQSLLAGSDASGSSPFADEYEVDRPEVESKVPCLVMDADSSQFSALVDIGENKNVAIEGPPGTGKSQTIVNAIAAAMADGKKVLFVAEKLAALNVVKARLEAIGLGEFLLPLQAEKSTREQVIASIKERLEMRDRRTARDYDEKLKEFRHVRQQLAEYIDLITRPFANTGLTIHNILGRSLATNALLTDVPREILENCQLQPDMLTSSGLTFLAGITAQAEKAHAETLAHSSRWQRTCLRNPERFTIEEICSLAIRASRCAVALSDQHERLVACGLDAKLPSSTLKALANCLAETDHHCLQISKPVLISILGADNSAQLKSFLDRCDAAKIENASLRRDLSESPSRLALNKVEALQSVCTNWSLNTIDPEQLEDQLQEQTKSYSRARSVSAALERLVTAWPAAKYWTLQDIAKAYTAYKEAGRHTLALRNSRNTEQDSQELIRSLCEDGIRLQQERSRLEHKLLLSAEATEETLVTHATTLRMSGTFSFLSASYRQAKRMFLSISKSKKYRKLDALDSLDQLISFRRKSAAFVARAEQAGVFGIHFRKLDTDFPIFVRLAQYYDEIDEHFGDAEDTSIQTFMLEAPAKHLEFLPAIPATNASISFDSLQHRIEETQQEIARLRNGKSALTDCPAILADRSIDPTAIPKIAHRLEALLEKQDELDADAGVRHILGERFSGHHTDTKALQDALSWRASSAAVSDHILSVLLHVAPEIARQTCLNSVTATDNLDASLLRLGELAKIDVATFMTTKSLSEAAINLEAAGRDPDGLFAHANFATAFHELEPHGLVPLAEERLNRTSRLSGLLEACKALAYRQLAKAVYAQHGAKPTKFRGTKLDELRASLAAKDKELLQLSRLQLRAKVKSSAAPRPGNGVGRKSTWTDMALIENEINKTQRFIPVRDLTQRAGRALLDLKPCWMMSPLAVAQYVPKGMLKFDLCIIDEASQMPPESAIGALLRCDQAVVVGDTNQLPPSSFFKVLIDDQDADEDETVLSESILEMANATFRPARRLRWHYRSRHSGLIKFSNRLIYDDNLIVFPSATEAMSRMGVEFRAVKGRYKAGTNPVEAKVIVEAILEFMRTDPNRSLGVVTLNQKQRDLISEELDYLIANDQAVQKYIDAWKEKNDGLEEFFVKNLENVQGDERDVIFIGTVYGAEESGGRVMQRFGPINGLAGKRRLNVLFSRAKEKIVTFSSMTAADIEADEQSNPGSYMLKRWLEYSATGVLDSGADTLREPDSDFEVFVIDQIRAMGCIPVPQVGVAGYFVDIGVRHPEWPHGYVLGVECDGATYHSAKSARDRDRLRQEILEGLGWQLHRIWSTDWFNSPRQEAERLRNVIANRLQALKLKEHEFHKAVTPPVAQTQPEADPDPAAQDLFSEDLAPAARIESKTVVKVDGRVKVGDTVRMRYLNDDRKTIKVTISKSQSDPSRGIIHHKSPVASALLGAEEGDEVEVLVGSYIRPAVIENIAKSE